MKNLLVKKNVLLENQENAYWLLRDRDDHEDLKLSFIIDCVSPRGQITNTYSYVDLNGVVACFRM